MATLKFANILLEQNPRSIEYPSLYCKGDASWYFDGHAEAWALGGKGVFDFTTYFNSLSVQKLRRYAGATGFSLELELKGASCKIVQTTADAFDAHPVVLEDAAVETEASDTWTKISIDLCVGDDAVLQGFQIITDGVVYLRGGSYFVNVSHGLRDVNLLLSTTTFKKEKYVTANIELLRSQILESDEEIADHFEALVVDNGKTLDVNALSGSGITICPNDNVGGAGGFARGMIEAIESEKGFTHILLMDDDVAVSPESIKRTYNLLRIAEGPYANAFISGAMLNYEVGDEQWEDTGFMNTAGYCQAAKPKLRLTKFEDVVYNEKFRVPGEVKRLNQRYAAWWYCAIPVEQIRKNGLPLPYFVRYDDAEYGVRCAPEFMTMNGICIWHDPFDKRYNAAAELYQTTRNELIASFTTGFAPNSDFLKEIYHKLTLELKKFGYQNAELVLDAFEDFLKGPDFYSSRGMAEKTFMDANRNKEKLVPLEQLEDLAIQAGIKGFELSQVDRQLIEGDKPRSMLQRVSDYSTNNGQRLVVTKGEGYAIISNMGGVYPAGVIRGKHHLIVIDWYNRTGVVRTKDPERYKRIARRYKQDIKQFKANERQLREAYAASRDVITSVEFWKGYLGLTD